MTDTHSGPATGSQEASTDSNGWKYGAHVDAVVYQCTRGKVGSRKLSSRPSRGPPGSISRRKLFSKKHKNSSHDIIIAVAGHMSLSDEPSQRVPAATKGHGVRALRGYCVPVLEMQVLINDQSQCAYSRGIQVPHRNDTFRKMHVAHGTAGRQPTRHDIHHWQR